MNASWNIGTLAGIPVRVHWTLLALVAVLGLTSDIGLVPTAIGAIGLFASVAFHELAHALTARRFGVETRDILLLPFGGVARLERLPAEGRAEVWIALAGPAASLVLFGAFGLIALALGGLSVGVLFTYLAGANLMLALFNLLPAFPMDGGRVLRGALQGRIGRLRATDIAATLGRWIAVAMAFYGLMSGNWSLVFIAAFVWFAGSAELHAVRILGDHFQAAWAGGAPGTVEQYPGAPFAGADPFPHPLPDASAFAHHPSATWSSEDVVEVPDPVDPHIKHVHRRGDAAYGQPHASASHTGAPQPGGGTRRYVVVLTPFGYRVRQV